MGDWYTGPWRVTGGSARDLRPGVIVRRGARALLFNCPACNAMQFSVVRLHGEAHAPTFEEPVQCGNGYCERCGVWFQVIDGKAVPKGAPPDDPVVIPEDLWDAGVRPPPKLNIPDEG